MNLMTLRLPNSWWRPFGAKVFAHTFHNWYGLRGKILRAFGATVATTARVRPTARITCPWNLTLSHEAMVGDLAVVECESPVSIGAYVTVSQFSHLCTRQLWPQGPGPAPICIGHDGWIGAQAFVGPGVTVGPGAILGANSSAFDDLEAWTIYGGDPMRKLKERPKLPALPAGVEPGGTTVTT
ncbi:colanic acid biosynthesis acetyltransferase WcaF [bacterium]|nr:MAG: colanic acid biosynthesis acetyltransferase WcaF [bacterium]